MNGVQFIDWGRMGGDADRYFGNHRFLGRNDTILLVAKGVASASDEPYELFRVIPFESVPRPLDLSASLLNQFHAAKGVTLVSCATIRFIDMTVNGKPVRFTLPQYSHEASKKRALMAGRAYVELASDLPTIQDIKAAIRSLANLQSQCDPFEHHHTRTHLLFSITDLESVQSAQNKERRSTTKRELSGPRLTRVRTRDTGPRTWTARSNFDSLVVAKPFPNVR